MWKIVKKSQAQLSIKVCDSNYGAASRFCNDSASNLSSQTPRRCGVIPRMNTQSQGSGGLLYGVQRALSHYVASHERAYHDFPGVFLNKAAYFLPNCTSTYSRNRLGWEPWQDVLKMADLQDWPHRRGLPLGDSRVSDTAAKIDALLGVFPFVQVFAIPVYIKQTEEAAREASTLPPNAVSRPVGELQAPGLSPED